MPANLLSEDVDVFNVPQCPKCINSSLPDAFLHFRFRAKYNAANAPAQTMLSAPSIAYFVSILAMSSAVVSIMFHPMPIIIQHEIT